VAVVVVVGAVVVVVVLVVLVVLEVVDVVEAVVAFTFALVVECEVAGGVLVVVAFGPVVSGTNVVVVAAADGVEVGFVLASTSSATANASAAVPMTAPACKRRRRRDCCLRCCGRLWPPVGGFVELDTLARQTTAASPRNRGNRFATFALEALSNRRRWDEREVGRQV
jgi:hypothetical protein